MCVCVCICDVGDFVCVCVWLCVCVYRACDYTGMHMSMHCLSACLSVCEPKYFLHVNTNLRTNPHAPVCT